MNNDYKSKKTVYMGNDGSGDDIKIPSVFVDYETGITLQVRAFAVRPQHAET